ncbi:hypothetical protein BV25DRAFT_1912754 [Artomyces pyxidatus]|uniref:Uncharacterized protein n=1 Tax=Artomyces pyxidatus TaxID=48021 RepID=A0ACB8TE61_9AGAM|nr:hypothetical protein BV25DRAFT_1912754 [Artomyces pyxidatus]
MSDSTQDGNWLGDSMNVLVAEFYPFAIETFLFGLFSGLIILSTSLLFSRSRSRANHVMFSLTILMYITAALHWMPWIQLRHIKCQSASDTAYQIILSDAIVAWRAWVIWGRSRNILFVSTCLILATVVAAIFNAIWGDGLSLPLRYRKLASSVTAVLSIITNLWATTLVAWKTWRHRRRLGTDLCEATRRTTVLLTLTLLVESGALYTLFWIFVVFGTAGLVGPAVTFFAEVIPQVAGIYPTIIIVLVCIRRTNSDIAFFHEEPPSLVQLEFPADMSSSAYSAPPLSEDALPKSMGTM